MQITIEDTPNSLAKKFVVTGVEKPFGDWQGSVNYQDTETPFGDNRSLSAAKEESPLATWVLENLRDFGVFSVAFSPKSAGENGVKAHITVGIKETPGIGWSDIEDVIKSAVEGHENQFLNGAFEPPKTQAQQHQEILDFFRNQHGPEMASQVEAILTAIEAYTPIIKGDGGSLDFKSYNAETGEIFVEMSGACHGCASTGDTLGNIEDALREFGLGDVKVINTAQDARFAGNTNGLTQLTFDGQTG